MRRSHSNQHNKVEQARAIVAQALGDAARSDAPQTTKFVPTSKPTQQVEVKSEAIGVLAIGEVATRLNISRPEVERMIASGKMRALETGFSLMVPTPEIERLRSHDLRR